MKKLTEEHKRHIKEGMALSTKERFGIEHRKRISQGVKRAIREGRLFNREHIKNLSHKGTNYSTPEQNKIRSEKMKGNKNLDGKIFGNNTRIQMSVKRSQYILDHPHIKLGRGKSGVRQDIGHFVRSTWEANFARILQYLGIEYQYEPRRITLGSINYIPDFYITGKRIYIEVKGMVDTKALNIVTLWRKYRHNDKMILIGPTKYKKLEKKYKSLIPEWE